MKEIMEKAKEMQAHMQKAQKEITAIEVEGVAGAGLVKVRMNGVHHALRVQISSSLLGEDEETIGDLVCAAINDASKKIEETTKKKMMRIAEDMKLPKDFSGTDTD